MSTAVQELGWNKELPREQYKELVYIKNSQEWFQVYKTDEHIYAIYEPHHFQEVISYLIIGSNYALLLDTGMGIGDMKTLVTELTDLPIVVLNTHSHFDHIGCNWKFSEGYILDTKPSRERMINGLSVEDVADNMVADSMAIPGPVSFDPMKYEIQACPHWKYIKSGHIFDLGNLKLKVIETPGHSPDSIMVVDEVNKILFTGDTFYPATLYAHLDSKEGMKSNLEEYFETMEQLAQVYGDYSLRTSHNEPICHGEKLAQVANALKSIIGGIKSDKIDEEKLKKYQFDGFAIVTK